MVLVAVPIRSPCWSPRCPHRRARLVRLLCVVLYCAQLYGIHYRIDVGHFQASIEDGNGGAGASLIAVMPGAISRSMGVQALFVACPVAELKVSAWLQRDRLSSTASRSRSVRQRRFLARVPPSPLLQLATTLSRLGAILSKAVADGLLESGRLKRVVDYLY